MEIIKQLEAYLEVELKFLAVGLSKETDPIQRSNIAWYCVQRSMGATQFANQIGVDFATAEAMFEAFKEKVLEMAENGA